MDGLELIPFVPEAPQTFHQLGILVLDGSGSMTEPGISGKTKGEEVRTAVHNLLERMNKSRVRSNFSFACIVFDNSPKTILPPTKLTELNYSNIDFNPVLHRGGGTHIFDALKEAKRIAENFLSKGYNSDLPHSVIILLMSDGMCFRADLTEKVANEIKRNPNIKIACAFFSASRLTDSEGQKAINLLRKIASGPSYYATVYDGETLRKFFEQSISQSSGTKF